jgi:predicted ATP-binding protein involved in virulence
MKITHKDLLSKFEKLSKLDNSQLSTKNVSLIIIGDNGSGKTTLLNQINKLMEKNHKVGMYTINRNRQFTEPNPFDS